MCSRAIVIVILLFLYNPSAGADKLQAAARGKKQLVQPLYGRVSSFDGTTLTFEEPLPPIIDQRTTINRILGGPQMTLALIPVKDTEIVITLGATDPQEPVDAFHPELSDRATRGTKDLMLQQAELQRAQLEKEKSKSGNTPVEFDLTRCSGPYLDQIVENNPQVSGTTKPPVLGSLQSIVNGIVTLKRSSDEAVLRYRLDALTEIRIGMCR